MYVFMCMYIDIILHGLIVRVYIHIILEIFVYSLQLVHVCNMITACSNTIYFINYYYSIIQLL